MSAEDADDILARIRAAMPPLASVPVRVSPHVEGMAYEARENLLRLTKVLFVTQSEFVRLKLDLAREERDAEIRNLSGDERRGGR